MQKIKKSIAKFLIFALLMPMLSFVPTALTAVVSMFSSVNPYIRSDATVYNGHSYKFYDTGMTWDNAKAYCENLGGHLATITTQEEENFITQLISPGTMGSYWLGARKINGTFAWITGETWSYTNFDAGEPNGSGDCLHIFNHLYGSGNVAGKWDDTNADGDHGGGIKYPQI